MSHFLLVCLAGALGTGVRFGMATAVAALVGTRFPWGILIVNVLGSFAIGTVTQLGAVGELMTPATRVVVTSGFLGGFTTYSAFNQDTVTYLEQDLWGRALVNVALTVVACLFAGLAGAAAGRRFGA